MASKRLALAVLVHPDEKLLCARADKDYAGDFDQPIDVRVPAERAFLFDAASGARLAL